MAGRELCRGQEIIGGQRPIECGNQKWHLNELICGGRAQWWWSDAVPASQCAALQTQASGRPHQRWMDDWVRRERSQSMHGGGGGRCESADSEYSEMCMDCCWLSVKQ